MEMRIVISLWHVDAKTQDISLVEIFVQSQYNKQPNTHQTQCNMSISINMIKYLTNIYTDYYQV